MLLGVDVGGTFTDAALIAGGRLITGKAPSTPADPSEGVIAAVESVLGTADVAPGDVSRFVHGMTVGTNALLEGKTAPTALLATEGFTDIEELGRQARAELYRLCAGHPPPLVPPERRVAVPERSGPDGVERALDQDLLRGRLADLDPTTAAAAVCLLWGFRHPEHERRVAEVLGEERPALHVSTSHETAAVFREYERLATTVVDAALSPLLASYLEGLRARARDAGLVEPDVMLSSGGVVDASAAARHGSWTVLSGPAGGAAGAAAVAARAGSPDALCLDMGGTSCDISVALGGAAAATGGQTVAGRALALPMVDVNTVGAGGGSVAWRDAGGALRVGPRSAGADPGPACYGRGGVEPTVTDADLVLGYLDVGSPLGSVRLDDEAARRTVGGIANELGLDVVEAAAGIAHIASVEMAAAARVVTVERGLDPRELDLIAFGGAGPLHAAAVADELGIERIVVPLASGVLSALGLIVSERRRDLVESVLLRGGALTRSAVSAAVKRLADRGRDELGAAEGAQVRAEYDLRYAGQAFELTIAAEPEPEPDELRAAFERSHEHHYGYADAEGELELVSIRLRVALPGAELPAPAERSSRSGSDRHPRSRPAVFEGQRLETRVHGAPSPGEALAGPAICELPEATLVVPPGWKGAADADGTIVLERAAE